MKPEIVLKKNKRRTLGFSVSLFLLAVYLFTYRGGFHSVDEVSIFAVTESLVKFGRFNTDQIAWTQWTTSQAEAQGFFGQDGHVYSKKGLALSLAQAPLYWLALYLPGVGMLQTVSLLNAFITAATGLLIFMFLQRLDFSTIAAIVVSLTFGLATIAFVYAKYLFSEPLAGLLLLLAAYMLFTYRQEGGLRHIAIAGLAAGFAVLTRANNLFLLPIFGLYLLWILYKSAKQRMSEAANTLPGSAQPPPGTGGRLISPHPPVRSLPVGPSTLQSEASPWDPPPSTLHSFILSPRHLVSPAFLQPLVVFLLTIAIAGAILIGYNALRSGNPLQTGYDLTLFSPNILLGLYKLLFSPLRGFFVYSPILILSLPGWWLLRRTYPAEAWLFAGLTGVTIGLFSAWSSGEGLSWGSRFLVPVVPFFAICLAPIVEMSSVRCQVSSNRVAGSSTANNTLHASRFSAQPPLGTLHASVRSLPLGRLTLHAPRFTLYALLLLSCLIQLLGVAINPWVFLAQLQAEFGGEFFLENTAALYDFRYSQIIGQIRAWSLQNSDVAWWQPWGFDVLAFGLSLGLVLLSGWLLWRQTTADSEQRSKGAGEQGSKEKVSPLLLRTSAPLQVFLTLALTYFLLARYFSTDQQFGPPDDAYTQALNTAVIQASPADQIVTVAPYHYHVPMNRLKVRLPITGLAQQVWPLPEMALSLLKNSATGQNIWLVTVGFSPVASNNAAEQWLTFNTFAASNDWFDDVRLVRFGAQSPTITRPINATFGQELRLVEIKVTESLQPGQTLPVEFVWQSLQRPQADYNLFLQLLTVDGALIAQHDSPPNGGYTPTSTWLPGQQLVSRHALALPLDLPTGTYQLIAGLYNPATGQRLAVDQKGNFVDLGQITLNVQAFNVAR